MQELGSPVTAQRQGVEDRSALKAGREWVREAGTASGHVGICQLLALCSPALCTGVSLSPVHGNLCLLQHGDKLMSYSMARDCPTAGTSIHAAGGEDKYLLFH